MKANKVAHKVPKKQGMMEKPNDRKSSSLEASKDLSMSIVPYEALIPLREVAPTPTVEE